MGFLWSRVKSGRLLALTYWAGYQFLDQPKRAQERVIPSLDPTPKKKRKRKGGVGWRVNLTYTSLLQINLFLIYF
jgi:hypothetical protein